MRFEFDGKTYLLEFQRDHKDISTTNHGETTTTKSKHPYTTVRLFLAGSSKLTNIEIATATVGCLPTDPYSNAAGRVFALRRLTGILRRLGSIGSKVYNRDFREALWKAYVERGKQRAPVTETVIEATATRVVEGPQQPLTVADKEELDERVIH